MPLLSIPFTDPLRAFAPFAGQPGAILLESAAWAGGRGRWSLLAVHPCRVLEAPADPFAALAVLRAEMAAWVFADDSALKRWPPEAERPPFQGGVVGWLSYEAGRHLERLPSAPPDDLGVPEAAFGLYDVVVAFDHHLRRGWISAAQGREDKAHALAAEIARAGQQALAPISPAGTVLVADQSRLQAEAAITAAIEAIWAGEIFQANVTQRFSGTLPPELSVWDLYRRLRLASPAPFAALASFGGAHLVSASPERFLSVSANGAVETRPIKGTRPRGRTPAEDAAFAQQLESSEKDRAENLMIVDLLRNDLARVCAVGSVRVPVLCGLESFASVHHLVSVVTGQLGVGADALDLLRASFPGGSIVGAPKIHAMEILRDLEPCPRGLYCGSLFWWGADGAFDSSILIRSLVVGTSGRVAAQAGGGIVSDSDPAAEWQEAMVKVAPLLRAVSNAPRLPRQESTEESA